jgi:hypothetical protein
MFAHVPIALGIQVATWIIGWLLGAPDVASVWMGAFAGAAVCIMREITQHEYRWIEAKGRGKRANMPGHKGLIFWHWNEHSISETLWACGASIVLAALVTAVR